MSDPAYSVMRAESRALRALRRWLRKEAWETKDATVENTLDRVKFAITQLLAREKARPA